MLNPTRLLAMARKELIQLRRDPRSLALAFALPILLLILFGYAISFDVRNIRMAVLDEDRSASSRELVEAFPASGYFTLTGFLERSGDIEPLMERGGAQLILVIPPGFEQDLGAGRTAAVQAIVDGSDANTATIVLGYSDALVRTWSSRVELQGRTVTPPVTAESRVWFNEELESRNMIVPGLVAVIMMIIAAMLTSLTIAREWERGSMEQLAATPVSRIEVVFGKLLPYLAIGLVDVVVTSVLGVLLFDVPFRGNALLLMILSFLFLIGALGLGMFISAVAKSQVVATQLAMVATYLPSLILSGFMYSIDSMPTALKAISYLIPARYFLVVTRGIFLKGVGMDVLKTQAFLMLTFAAVGLGLAVVKFKKELG
ncbi:MAG TPA: ABC transporter permease [Thermoanaerobaculia bacterium]|jgi:ABC-2 type transport system permease protein|nr:ABC transporter permease [Thermoanaerobaculia bacterium]